MAIATSVRFEFPSNGSGTSVNANATEIHVFHGLIRHDINLDSESPISYGTQAGEQDSTVITMVETSSWTMEMIGDNDGQPTVYTEEAYYKAKQFINAIQTSRDLKEKWKVLFYYSSTNGDPEIWQGSIVGANLSAEPPEMLSKISFTVNFMRDDI